MKKIGQYFVVAGTIQAAFSPIIGSYSDALFGAAIFLSAATLFILGLFYIYSLDKECD